MVRIGRQVPHYEMVEPGSLDGRFSEDLKYRYRLTISFLDPFSVGGRDKSLAVIMKNPSSADVKQADATIRRVEAFIYNRFPEVNRLEVLNLFAYRATDASDLENAYRKCGEIEVVGPENDRYIRETIENSDYIIAGWGNRSGIDPKLYDSRIAAVGAFLKIIGNKKCYCITGKDTTKYPLHGLMWGYNYDIVPAQKYLSEQ